MRFGKKTSLTPITLKLIGNTSEEQLMEDIAVIYNRRRVDYNVLTVACFEEANKGDEVALEILTEMADGLARSAASAVVRLDLGETPEVVLAGSVYVKGSCPIMVEEVKRKIDFYSQKKCDTHVLTVPPATGAIIWAYELATGSYPSYEKRMEFVKTVEETLAKMEKK